MKKITGKRKCISADILKLIGHIDLKKLFFIYHDRAIEQLQTKKQNKNKNKIANLLEKKVKILRIKL